MHDTYHSPMINLLPWRVMQRAQENRRLFFKMGGIVFVFLGLLVFLHGVILIKINHQMNKNQAIERAIQIQDEKIKQMYPFEKKREDVLAHIKTIRDLQVLRYGTIKILNELNHILPQGVVLVEMRCNNNKMILTGYSDGNAGISKLMKNIIHSQLFENPRLKEIKTHVATSENKVWFQLQMTKK